MIWKNRFKTITKISYYRGLDAKPHTLLFEINPEHNPKEDFAFEILNSFSQRYKSTINNRVKVLEVGNRAELISTCVNPDPEFPDVYIKEWRIFVKLDDLYFEKQFNDLSCVFFFIDFPIVLTKDNSRGVIIDWDHDYFFGQVSPESETVLYPIKSDKCEKSDQGLKKEKPLRPVQQDKKECQRIASQIWKKHPILDIVHLKKHPEILKIAGKNYTLYTKETIHRWLSEKAPEKASDPGKRPKETREKQKKICEKIGIKI